LHGGEHRRRRRRPWRRRQAHARRVQGVLRGQQGPDVALQREVTWESERVRECEREPPCPITPSHLPPSSFLTFSLFHPLTPSPSPPPSSTASIPETTNREPGNFLPGRLSRLATRREPHHRPGGPQPVRRGDRPSGRAARPHRRGRGRRREERARPGAGQRR